MSAQFGPHGEAGQTFDGRRIELWGKVYEWAWDPEELRWSLELTWTDEEMELIAEMLRALNSGDADAANSGLERLNDLGNYDFGEAIPRA